jgi:N-acetylneuraminic acid mutarotase
MKRNPDSARALALPRTLLIALLVVAAIWASRFEATSFSQARTANLNDETQVAPAVAARSPRLGEDGAVRLASLSASSPRTSQPRELSLADRYGYQRAIEEVYWRHRIWPKERPDPKPSLDEVMSPGQIERTVENSLRNCRVLEEHWQQPIRAGQLQAEMDRMARQTKQPEVLRELFSALGNDPFVIAECLAKSVLSERLVSNLMRQSSVDKGLRDPLDKSRVEPAEYVLPTIAGSSDGFSEISGSQGCTDNTWTATAVEMPQARRGHTAVWTGSEMIVWGGYVSDGSLNTGARYNPATDSWTPISLTNAPEARAGHAAIWTGSEMIIWGGYDWSDPLSTGGRYDPGTDTWVTTSLTNVPEAGSGTAVWTGSEMIIWGINTGGRYNPGTDSWTPISVTNAPGTGGGHTAIWTGSEMIVWGGNISNTGGKYNPQTDSWTPTSLTNAPEGRASHTAVWTGSEMIVWGGLGFFNSLLNNGGKYNPETDSWASTSLTNAPAARFSHTAIWAGSEMIVWGGEGGGNTGRKYDPGTDSWTPTSLINAPEARSSHTAVWTGSEMIIWGGEGNVSNRGGRYNPQTDSWTETNVPSFAPVGRHDHTAVWTGSEMIIWGGDTNNGFLNSGGKYNPGTDSWVATSLTNAPEARFGQTAVWTGSEMIVWGGFGVNTLGNTGGRYNPQTDSWTATSLSNAPEARYNHSAVWTGSEMIIWGGDNFSTFSSAGGRYNPETDSWTATSLTNAPVGRREFTTVWTGSEMIVWGGYNSNIGILNSGGRYNPGTDSWTSTSVTNAPGPRTSHTAVWTGSEMIIWGGDDYPSVLNTGGRYDPETDSWTATSLTNAPLGREYHTAVWTGSEMIIWGGDIGKNDNLTSGGRYDASTDRWGATSSTNTPVGRQYHTAVWTGTEMIIWGGYGNFNSGGRLCGQSGPTTLANISTRLRVETGDGVGIGGFIVTGTQSKKVMVRAIGPSLPLPGALPNPILELRNSSGALIQSNDNWRNDQEPEIVATGIPPSNDLESAIVATLPANGSAYSAVVRGVGNGTGIGLVEVYDLERTVDSKLANISTRGFVGTGDDVMIGGTIVQGAFSSSVILRGIGPSLANAGVPDVLADPTLELHDGNGALLVANDNWQDDSASAAQLIAYGLAPQPLESGIFVSLAPGAYTAILAGKGNGTGVGLVEAYQVE